MRLSLTLPVGTFLILGMFTLFSTPAVAETARLTGSPNPIDWTITDSFATQVFDDFIPLRVGQHDFHNQNGFGVRHIIDGHGAVPPRPQISSALAVGACAFQSPNDTWVCNDGETTVVFTTRVDSRSPDHRPVGIITAFECGCRILP